MSFWDYIPGVSNIKGAINGNMAQAVGGAGYHITDKVTGGTEAAGQAGQAQRGALDQAMKRLQEFSAQHYKNRMADLDKTMSFYGPAERYLQSIYGPAAQQPPPSMPGMPGIGGPGGMPKRGMMG